MPTFAWWEGPKVSDLVNTIEAVSSDEDVSSGQVAPEGHGSHCYESGTLVCGWPELHMVDIGYGVRVPERLTVPAV